MINIWMQLLTTQVIALSCILILILGSRPWIHKLFGSRLNYQLWLLLPLALTAQLLPAPTVIVSAVDFANVSFAEPINNLQSAVVHITQMSVNYLFIIWVTGFIASITYYIFQYHHFRKFLGEIKSHQGYSLASRRDVGPVLLGFWRPSIVMPSDFESAFSKDEQALMLTHEEIHRCRFDSIYNTFSAVFLCLYWFHPLVHFAVTKFRADQELACDAKVLELYPNLKRCYAELLLKIAASEQISLINCHINQLVIKERIMNIYKMQIGNSQKRLGKFFFIALSIFSMSCAWASTWWTPSSSTPVSKPTEKITTSTYMLSTEIDIDGERSFPRIMVTEGQKAKIVIDLNGSRREFEFLLTTSNNSITEENVALTIDTRRIELSGDQQKTVHAKLIVALGAQSRIDITDDADRSTISLMVKATRSAKMKKMMSSLNFVSNMH